MSRKKISKEREIRGNKVKALFMVFLAFIVAGTFFLYALSSEDLGSSAGLVVIAAILLVFFALFGIRRYRDASKGMAFEDERSKRVIEKAAAASFYVSLYALLAISWISDGLVQFRDPSQATNIGVGIMALLFFIFWIYYSRKQI